MIRMDDRDLEALSAPLPRPWFRGHDRRMALARLIATLVQHVQSGHESPPLRVRFEAGVCEALRVRAVRLREESPPYMAAAPSGGDGPRRKCIEVPTRGGAPRVVLEALIDSEIALDPWDNQLFLLSAQLASLVLELE